ncbi:Hypothetical Protein MfeM64YM_0289 [Mycoplasmopsis fermentans M64]|uniref:Uncharacterized protein n=1 Tax=Mycoplasmopsis fermentans (strain M64) TaxID=943945 RepID=A0AB32XAW8_MYCFM|nr:Hypothetical Protein MfeM64YM_0289 [Mycoplasmopsis fermentans M64]
MFFIIFKIPFFPKIKILIYNFLYKKGEKMTAKINYDKNNYQTRI